MKTPLDVKPKQSHSFVEKLGRISLHCEFRVLYSRLFLTMATFRDDYQDIFGESVVKKLTILKALVEKNWILIMT